MTKRLLDDLFNEGMNFHEATTDRLTGGSGRSLSC